MKERRKDGTKQKIMRKENEFEKKYKNNKY